MNQRSSSPLPFAVLVSAVSVIALTSCGSDDADTTPSATDDSADVGPETVAIIGVDYAYSDVPDVIEAGTELTLTNDSAEEIHELLAFRVDDGVEATAADFLEGGEEFFAENATFVGVAVAPPESESFSPTGPVVLTEPGRYVLTCFIPQGVDPAAYLAAAEAAQGGPPDIEGGPPHAVLGMITDVDVE